MDMTIAPGCGRALQRRRRRDSQLSNTARKTFLDHLAATCNVRQSAAAAGYAGTASFYKVRRDDAAFAAAWRDAMAIGYDRLEETLLSHALGQIDALAGASDVDAPPVADPDAVALRLIDRGSDDRGAPPAGTALAAGFSATVVRMEVQLALAMLRHHAAVIARNGPPRRRGRATAEEVETAVAAKLDRLADQLAQQRR